MDASLARTARETAASAAEYALSTVQGVSRAVGRHLGRVLVSLLLGSAGAWWLPSPW